MSGLQSPPGPPLYEGLTSLCVAEWPVCVRRGSRAALCGLACPADLVAPGRCTICPVQSDAHSIPFCSLCLDPPHRPPDSVPCRAVPCRAVVRRAVRCSPVPAGSCAGRDSAGYISECRVRPSGGAAAAARSGAATCYRNGTAPRTTAGLPTAAWRDGLGPRDRAPPPSAPVGGRRLRSGSARRRFGSGRGAPDGWPGSEPLLPPDARRE